MTLAIILFAAGIMLLLSELVMPSMILGAVGMACLIAAIVAAFLSSNVIGIVFVLLALVLIPLFVILWVPILGKYMAVKTTESTYSSASKEMDKLLGQEGVALTTLRPAGIARIGNQRIDVVADGEAIERDTRVKVVEVSGNRVVVHSVRA
jgi:membrane-bound serine protease (ClpP class)